MNFNKSLSWVAILIFALIGVPSIALAQPGAFGGGYGPPLTVVPPPKVFATFHPSAILRVRGEAEREAAFKSLVRDLALLRSIAPARHAQRQDRPGSSAPPSAPRRPSPSVRRGG